LADARNLSALAMTVIALGELHPHMRSFLHRQPLVPTQPRWLGIGRFSTILKGLTMNARFLRDEATRFRGMAEDADREATKLRLLAMAADYEARAGIDNELTEPNSVEETSEVVEPTQDEAAKITLGRKITAGSKETVPARRRPVGRPRRE
jgi:hypothetical protein